jgi:cyclopropane-fatty-acyl-phospholipid synthase
VLKRLVETTFRSRPILFRLPGGREVRGAAPGDPELIVTLADWRSARRILANPELGLGEAYMDRGLTIEGGDLYDFLDLAAQEVSSRPRRPMGPGWRFRRWLDQANDRVRARRNVAHHYDLTVDFYRLFLDEDLQYSCAYFEGPEVSLEAAQVAKKRLLLTKLGLRPGERVLDIGCGWGGLGLTLAEAGGRVTGVTLSAEQHALANRRAADRSLEDRAEFRRQDYRDLDERFDRIVSVGMFEHVGVRNYQAYFDGVARLLKDDGVAVIHSIGRKGPSSRTQPWIAKHIFPGGYIPSLSEVMPAIELSGLWITDMEVLRLHYAETLKAWRERFLARRAEAVALYDERFCRMWEFYLASSEVGFRRLGHMVFQIQLAKQQTAVPLTRDYLCRA